MAPKSSSPSSSAQNSHKSTNAISCSRALKEKHHTTPAMDSKTKRSIALLLLLLDVFTQHRAVAQVFCRSQFNLANEACSLRTIPTGSNPARPLQLHSNGSSYELQADHHGRDREHARSRRHGGLGHGGADPYDTACCRRLMGIDNACICQAMSYLPVFMSRVKHAIKLTPVPGCDVSFECAAVY